MLARGRHKVLRSGYRDRIRLEHAAAEELPFPDASFDAATVAFGVRNFSDLDQGLAEIERVLRPGGTAIVLEFSRPRGRVWGALYRYYSLHVLPFLGGIISRNREAYEYLPRTVAEFPDGDAFAKILMKAGFSEVRWYSQCGGIAMIYVVTK
jgi:demethylmenaquinone methyltransferase/2-methoxy-6-polyprenyl-1,4-benzoquinol methylase